jgi:hypothetical protein
LKRLPHCFLASSLLEPLRLRSPTHSLPSWGSLVASEAIRSEECSPGALVPQLFLEATSSLAASAAAIELAVTLTLALTENLLSAVGTGAAVGAAGEGRGCVP